MDNNGGYCDTNIFYSMTNHSTTIAIAQINPVVGDIPGNTKRVIAGVRYAQRTLHARIVIFPELVLCGYPPEDLLLRPSMKKRIAMALERLYQLTAKLNIYIIIGYPRYHADNLYNCAGIIYRGETIVQYSKQHLPNYQVFDEKRYFVPGDEEVSPINIDGLNVYLTICEDIWHPAPVQQAAAKGADVIFNINASPFHRCKQDERIALVQKRAQQAGAAVVYVNQVGGQDELVFDGGSMAVDREGTLCALAPNYTEGYYPLHICKKNGTLTITAETLAPPLPQIHSIYHALKVGVKDYVEKNGFKGVVLGLSGGIDSALTLAIAADALGSQNIFTVMMPFQYTAPMSRDDAAQQAQNLGVTHRVLPIHPMVEACQSILKEDLDNRAPDKTEENIQARCRGILLMALSNRYGYLVLTTGNKSELAVGYSTLYGDMAGGFSVLKDIPKTLVYELAQWRNSISPVIPQRVIDRPPSAELAPQQKDSDSLPPYPILDQIIEQYIEHDKSLHQIVANGFDEETVVHVIRLIDRNEYKRRQSPIGVRVTQRGFGRDRRYPVTARWEMGE